MRFLADNPSGLCHRIAYCARMQADPHKDADNDGVVAVPDKHLLARARARSLVSQVQGFPHIRHMCLCTRNCLPPTVDNTAAATPKSPRRRRLLSLLGGWLVLVPLVPKTPEHNFSPFSEGGVRGFVCVCVCMHRRIRKSGRRRQTFLHITLTTQPNCHPPRSFMLLDT